MDTWHPAFAAAAVRTLQAPRWHIWMASLFGTRVEGRDGSSVAIGYLWRGKMYMTDFQS